MLAVRPEAKKRLVGLVQRVSTDMQAANDEGSLKTQLQRMRQHVAYKSETVGEAWEEVGVYDQQVASGKDSLRTLEFQRLLADIRAGKVNTILCTELDRVCRNLKEFLELLEILKEFDVEFASIKEQFDTTTPQGRFTLTLLMALAQLERERTAERTREAMVARSERGLSNGGQIFGFDLDPDRKGYLVPNEAEAAGVDFVMDAFLEHGTIAAAQAALNRAGYRTKGYTSRRGVHHPSREFSFTTVQHILKNPAYVGKKRVGDRLVDAVWPAVVDEEKFNRVQALLAASARSKRSAAKPIRHVYVLNGGLLHCGCGSAMEGRSGTGRGGIVYFYYACRNKECGLRVAADEMEGVVLDHLQALGQDDHVVERLAAEANARLQRRLPSLRKRRASMVKHLAAIAADADHKLSGWSSLADERARTFVTDALNALAQQRDDLQTGIGAVERDIEALEAAQVSAESVRAALASFSEVYECLQPYERKELVRLLLHRAEVCENRITLEIRGGLAGPLPTPGELKSASRSVRPKWLPDVDSNHEPTG